MIRLEPNVYHNSQASWYREPFGALPCGQRVSLRLKTAGDVPAEAVWLCLRENEEPERSWPMRPALPPEPEIRAGETAEPAPLPVRFWEIEYTVPAQPVLVWYSFRVQTGERTWFYGNNQDESGGPGELRHEAGAPYQITVYKPAPVAPWFKQGIMYQIFVDRFYRGGPQPGVLNPKPGSLLHGHWEDTPCYVKDAGGRVTRWTFFGGNLEGVREKLAYLEELGITIIYFNPVFEAASNHKYDTGDYLKIDPMYGDNESFARLVQEAVKHGIAVMLDGVFSHTGSDSIYFNQYGSYPGMGAYQSKLSPYYPWYKFQDWPAVYECWWDVDSLPNVNEMEPSYQKFIFGGEDSVVRYWMRQGVKGWRLDVADELPDQFIRQLRQAVKEENHEAVLLGEVWEDASNKISYGERRQYWGGDELDSVTNYPLRSIMLDYMLGTYTAEKACRRIMSLYENYPPENFRAAMNLLGSHDRIRILTLVGEAPDEANLSLAEREKYRLPAAARQLAIQRLKALVLLQMTLPGVPCIYYGDEAGMEGFSDPFNRGTFPWGGEDRELQEWYRKLIRLRKEYDLFREGEFTPFYHGADVLGFRTSGSAEEIIVAVNRSPTAEAYIETEPGQTGGLALDLLSGEKLSLPGLTPASNARCRIKLKPLEGKVLYFRHSLPANGAWPQLSRCCGILLHLTSLPSAWGIGDMGRSAERFVDFLAAGGQQLWQIMPLNPPGPGFSPYQSGSVFAGSSLLISLDKLRAAGLLTEEAVRRELAGFPKDAARVDYPLVAALKQRLLTAAFQAFKTRLGRPADGLPPSADHGGGYLSPQGYLAFQQKNRFWLDDYCLYMLAKEQNRERPWYEWSKAVAGREPEALDRMRKEGRDRLDYHRFVQYTFYHQWQDLKKYANKRGIKIIGDMPIYAAGDSCDVWAHPEFFNLDAEGRPAAVAGVPPDYFSADGQLWGNPLYAWEKMKEDHYSWWMGRVEQALAIFDAVRLDHFRAFEAFWAIPADAATARPGRWLKGPGRHFFEILAERFGPLPFIAEDLGFITPEVHNLRNILGFPGMKVYQFESGAAPGAASADHTVYYSGTHDNDTLLGWCKQHGPTGRLTGQADQPACQEILTGIYKSQAPWVIIPMQDILGLDSDSRMNVPGTLQENWAWRMQEQDLGADNRNWLREMTKAGERLRNGSR